MRRIVFYEKEGNRTFVFYTNNLLLSAENIALAYKYRWRVELFFKWVKLHLHVKEFCGTSENAVKIQLYCAIIDYCLVAIVERKMKLDMEMYDLLRFLSVSLLDRTPLRDLLGKNQSEKNLQTVRELSLNFFSGHQWSLSFHVRKNSLQQNRVKVHIIRLKAFKLTRIYRSKQTFFDFFLKTGVTFPLFSSLI